MLLATKLAYATSMPPVDRAKFEAIVANLLKQKPATRAQQGTGTRKSSATIIPPTPESGHRPASGKAAAKSEPTV
jgi:hypothetical protein